MSDRGGVARNRSALNRVAEKCHETEKSIRAGAREHRRAGRYHAALASLAIIFIATAASPASTDDVLVESRDAHKIAYSFVFMGCNRLLKGDKSPDNPSTANLPQLERSFTEIAAIRPRPSFVVFTGDLVLGLTSNLTELRDQLDAWIDVYRNSDLGHDKKIRLIAMPGNHESLVGEKGAQKSNPGAEAVWLTEMQS